MRTQPARSSRARRAIGWTLGVALGASLAVACVSIIGIDDRLPDDATGDGSVADDRATLPDDHFSVPNSCAPMATCVNVPAGWQLTSLDSDKRRGCAAGYGAPENVVVADDGLECTCKCTETAPGSCAAAGATASFREYPAAGCSAAIMTYVLSGLDGGCTSAAITTTPAVRTPPPLSGPPSCAADASPSPLKNGQACTAEVAPCNDGGRCARALRAGELLCVTKAGDVACPAGYDKKFPVGTSIGADTRRCGTCTCTPATACGTPSIDLFAGAGCTGANLVVPTNGSCMDVDAGVSYASYRFTGKAPGCLPSVPPLLDGGVTILGPKTVCCAGAK